jgi:hypothetical protein
MQYTVYCREFRLNQSEKKNLGKQKLLNVAELLITFVACFGKIKSFEFFSFSFLFFSHKHDLKNIFHLKTNFNKKYLTYIFKFRGLERFKRCMDNLNSIFVVLVHRI